ncbi:PEP-CTERM-box response regulator transcription factor [Sphingomonas oligophenolica]|uniref:PEP-CTERM-box response regulator transcription factor n=1 Tax=Sphingomonas oligophenolica TaxID=301154 RepID=A0A502CQP6_9SPHN|nr:PEP-CTERM-box response regulator transcription factor [Sphingomonas oligophenolica]TPG15547.1 PEP-CTERM-box response regulator transcription factor [Sphingomonas oligophenolica]
MSDKPVLLVVEDDAALQRQLRWAYDGYEVVCAGTRAAAIDAVRAHEPAVVTLDLGLPPDPDGTSEGFATLAEMLALKPDTKVIVASGHGARDSARHAIAQGAWDFYAKPIDIDALGLIVSRAFHVHALEAENRRLAARGDAGFGGLIYASPEMTRTVRTIERVAPADVSVMLLGASGTGKELLARGLHDMSSRSGGAFVAINCAAIPETLLESELFGHEKGAFTGAVRTVEGKIEQASGGTLFLDEIGDVPLALQVKLLRFLQERVIERLGGRKPIAVDTRIVCATHQDIDAMVAAGSFRDDLYYRLAEIVVRIPALGERSGDAGLLARHFVTRHAATMKSAVTGLAPDALAAIDAWGWPGNVRELENRIKRAVIMADGKTVTAADLDLDDSLTDALPLNLRTVREIADRKAIRHALSRSDGNIAGASRLLGVSRPTLYDLLKTYDLHG